MFPVLIALHYGVDKIETSQLWADKLLSRNTRGTSHIGGSGSGI